MTKLSFFLTTTLLCIWAVAFGQQKEESIVVLPIGMSAPANAKMLGAIKAGNNATKTRCDYEALIAELKRKATHMSGNIVKITQLVAPAFVSKCYKVHADVYRAEQLPQFNNPSADAGKPAAKVAATIYFYRLRDTVSPSPAFSVHVDDSAIMTIKRKRADSINIDHPGPITIWAKNEKRTELRLDVKPGERYFVRCGVEKGQFKMVPVIQLVDPATGEAEYNKMRNGKKDMDVKYLYQVH